MAKSIKWLIPAALGLSVILPYIFSASLCGQTIRATDEDVVNKEVTIIGVAAGSDLKAEQQALAEALRKAVEQSCGVFVKAQSQSKDYKLVYDKIFANTVGFVREHKVLKTWPKDGKTFVQIRAVVSTQRFEEDWATIAHLMNRANNPRMIIVIAEATNWTTTSPAYTVKEDATVQTKLESFFISKGISLRDRKVSEKVSKRDIHLAGASKDPAAVAKIGARFQADIVITGNASAKFNKTSEIGGIEMFHYVGNLNIRAVHTDSAELIVSKSYRISTVTTERGTGEQKALEKLADDCAPKVLAAIVEALRKKIYVRRTIHLTVEAMDHSAWKLFKSELAKVHGVEAMRLREITEKLTHADVEYLFNNEIFLDEISKLKIEGVKFEIREVTANRLRLRVTKPAKKPAKEPAKKSAAKS